MTGISSTIPLVCLSHLRWNFVFQRPQHLMRRFATERAVYFIEEPIRDAATSTPHLERRFVDGVHVVVPRLGADETARDESTTLKRLVRELLATLGDVAPVFWLYTPMAFDLIHGVPATLVVYDCMDDLTGFVGAPPDLAAREADLLTAADLVFTGGFSLYKAKRALHPAVFSFPSSVDVAHFAQARNCVDEPADMAGFGRPRLGYCGVIDERLDVPLLGELAEQRPDLQIVMIGPIVKIDPATLPTHPNIHYLGMKPYDQLPRYFAGWDAGWLPFARNKATRFISPTKTPEYLAAGLPVISTSIADVVRPYGEAGLAAIADTAGEVSVALTSLLSERNSPHGLARQAEADRFLSTMSWDRTWEQMNRTMADRLASRRRAAAVAQLRSAPRPAAARALWTHAAASPLRGGPR